MLETNGIWDVSGFLSPADELFRLMQNPGEFFPQDWAFIVIVLETSDGYWKIAQELIVSQLNGYHSIATKLFVK